LRLPRGSKVPSVRPIATSSQQDSDGAGAAFAAGPRSERVKPDGGLGKSASIAINSAGRMPFPCRRPRCASSAVVACRRRVRQSASFRAVHCTPAARCARARRWRVGAGSPLSVRPNIPRPSQTAGPARLAVPPEAGVRRWQVHLREIRRAAVLRTGPAGRAGWSGTFLGGVLASNRRRGTGSWCEDPGRPLDIRLFARASSERVDPGRPSANG